MVTTPPSSEETKVSTCYRDCFNPPTELLANPDIGGIGVLVGFVATAWLVVFIVVLRYCLAFDPNTDPLANPTRDQRRGRNPGFKPNPIDVKTVRMLSGLRRRIGHHSHWNMVFTKILLRMCDVQLLTGLGILLSSFISLNCYISAYHWQIMSYLAWFSNLTHAACLTALREYLYQHQLERNFRMALMIILLAGLITAIIPTGYFNWEGLGTAAVPASNARCFFTQTSAQKIWDSRACQNSSWPEIHSDGYECNLKDKSRWGQKTAPEATAAYESSVISILILTFSFAGRSVKMFRTLSKITKQTIRPKMGLWAASVLAGTARAYEKVETTAFQKRLLSFSRPLDLIIALYLVGKLYVEVLSSEMADIFWLVISSIWGTTRLLGARDPTKVDDSEDEWGFGQILPVFLLLGPIVMVLISIFTGIKKEKQSERQEQEKKDSIVEAISLLEVWQIEMTASQRGGSETLHRLSSVLQVLASGPSNSAEIRRGVARNRFEAISTDEYQQSPEGDGSEGLEPRPMQNLSSAALGATKEEIVPLPNQVTMMRSKNTDIRASLSAGFLESQWMTTVIWLFCLQSLAPVIYVIIVLSDGSRSPSSVLKESMFSIFIIQPLNNFIAVLLGLYIHEGRASKLQNIRLCILLLLGLFVWEILTLFWISWLGWYFIFSPLAIVVIQFLYLGFKQNYGGSV